ncbi:MAG: AsmA family protein [Bacteroides sp.]|nr:AsmA family protein [Bacteroides sp.]
MNKASVSIPIKKILTRTGIVIVFVFLLFFLIAGILLKVIVTPQKITPVILGLTRDYINAQVNCESIDITYFSTFPNLGVKLENGSIIHYPETFNDTSNIQVNNSQDTLITFQKSIVSINPIDFLFNQKVVVRQLEIENSNIYAFVDKDGKANWDIFISSEQEKEKEKTSEMPELNINNIRFKNIQITYDDQQQDVFVLADSLQVRLNGNLSQEQANLDLRLRTAGITSYFKGKRYCNSLPLRINTQLMNDKVAGKLTVEKGNITVGVLKLKSVGTLKRTETPRIADVDMEFSLNTSSLSELLGMIPHHISDIPSKFHGHGKISSKGKITGQLGKDIYPIINWSFQVDNGTFYAASHPDQPLIERIETDFKTVLDFSGKQKSSIQLNNLFLQQEASTLILKGTFDNILKKPAIRAQAKADINFSQLTQKLALTDSMQMGGQINFDLSANCLLDDILTSNLGKIDINGDASIKNVFLNYPAENLFLYAPLALMEFGSNTEDSIRGKLIESLFRGNIRMDSISLNWKEELALNLGNLSARFRTSEVKDTSQIALVTTMARAKNIRLNMGDSVRIRAFKTNAAIRLHPQKDNTALPEINAHVSLDTLRGVFYTIGGRVHQAKLNLKINKRQSQHQQTSGFIRRDTTLTQAERDSIRRNRTNSQTNVSFRLESQDSRKLLRNWEASGSFGSKNVSLRTPYFPLPLRMSESDLNFTSNSLSLKKANLQIGNSHLILKGEIEGIRRALLFNGKIAAKLTLEADSIDFNELIKAAVAGSDFTQKSLPEKDSIAQYVLDESNDTTQNLDSIQSGIFVIPRNLDIEFNSKIKHARYTDLLFDNIQGRIILKDQAIHLQRIMVGSKIGNATMTLVYKAPDAKGAHLGMDMKMENINLKELISAFPVIESLTPMLRSFEGVVDCDMTALTELDSLMNVQLPMTTASCHLEGINMVLLDGETFSEISNTLMFKKKSRNIIDSLSVEMIMEDEKLMIFPFQLSMDRYKVAVGGIQNLDMTFDYHITVLKSPIPFKLGLNITGNPDKMKIRLAKPKYKDIFTVAREQQLDNTTINIRKEMENKLRRSILEILGSPLTRPVVRPSISLPDSLKRAYFQLDTTKVEIEEPLETKPQSNAVF